MPLWICRKPLTAPRARHRGARTGRGVGHNEAVSGWCSPACSGGKRSLIFFTCVLILYL